MPKIVSDHVIYSAAIRLIVERGYHGATTKKIAHAAGVSEVTIFRKYGNKQALVQQALEAVVQNTNIPEVTEFTGDIRKDLLRILRSYESLTTQSSELFIVMIAEMVRDPELGEWFTIPYAMFQKMSRLISSYQDQGVLRKETPSDVLAALLGPLMYVVLMRRALPATEITPLDLQKHVEAFLDGHLA